MTVPGVRGLFEEQTFEFQCCGSLLPEQVFGFHYRTDTQIGPHQKQWLLRYQVIRQK